MTDLLLQVWHVRRIHRIFQFDLWHHSRRYIYTTTSHSSSSSRDTKFARPPQPYLRLQLSLITSINTLIHGLPIWGLLNSLLWSTFLHIESAIDLLVSSKQEVSYFRLFEYQWFVVNHLFIPVPVDLLASRILYGAPHTWPWCAQCCTSSYKSRIAQY